MSPDTSFTTYDQLPSAAAGKPLNESSVETAALDLLRSLGYRTTTGKGIVLDAKDPDDARLDARSTILPGRLRAALRRLNPGVPDEAVAYAVAALTRAEHPDLIGENARVHQLLVDGVDAPVTRPDGSSGYVKVRLLDPARPDAHDFLAVQQVEVAGTKGTRRFDVVIFVNGLALAVLELKNPFSQNATLESAWRQLRTYADECAPAFAANALLVVGDGLHARLGALTVPFERFAAWKTVAGEPPASGLLAGSLTTLLTGVFDKERFLRIVTGFVLFERRGPATTKKLAQYHQYWAVRKAVARTLEAVEASRADGRRIGVVWHTQGSGKSLSMTYYAGAIAREPAMANPTLVVLTDRNDLDGQLFDQFAACERFLGQPPAQAGSREELQALLRRAGGGIVFTTIQKFAPPVKGEPMPLLSDRRNIVVVADEAHRSQYDVVDGFARHLRDALPNAAMIGFTGTPIETADRSTRHIFGDYIDTYDIPRAVEDGATVPISYEGRLVKLHLEEEAKAALDLDYQELVREAQPDEPLQERVKQKIARLEEIAGHPDRLEAIAADIVEHFEARQSAMRGKAMIVTMSRRIAVDLYAAIVRHRPDWHDPDDAKGKIKVVMTGSAGDPEAWQPHIRLKPGRDAMARRFKDPNDGLELVIVRDMWLTGFDVPCLHTMYLDKAMRGHALMQAIARVNRVFGDKPGGLVVDYLGLAEELRQALTIYGRGSGDHVGIDQREALAKLLETLDVLRGIMHGFAYRLDLRDEASQLAQLQGALDHILGLTDGEERVKKHVLELSKAFALAVPLDEAMAIREEVAWFQYLGKALAKTGGGGEGGIDIDFESAVRQLVSRAVVADGIVDLWGLANKAKPDISLITPELIAELQAKEHKNLAVEMLRRLLNDEIRAVNRTNVVVSKRLSEKLQLAMNGYHNRSITAFEAMEALLEVAQEMQAHRARAEELGISPEEVAFYDALADNASAIAALGEPILQELATELAKTLRGSVTVDWTVRETVRAKIRVEVKRLLRKYKYPPDQTEAATTLVLEQAERFAAEWAAA